MREASSLPSRLVVSAAAVGAVPLLVRGGNACGEGCASPLGFGGIASLSAGYRAGSGLGVLANVGYVSVKKSYDGRTDSGEPVGVPANPGKSNEQLSLSGLLVGVAGSYEGPIRPESRWRWSGRIGGGVLFARYQTLRDATLTTVPTSVDATAFVPQTYAIRGQSSGSRVVGYVMPDARISYAIANDPPGRFTIDAGLAVYLFLGLDKANANEGATVTSGPQGLTIIGKNEPLFGSLVLVGGPYVGVTATF